jgi:SAM-dependent methyltransferase
VVCGDCGLAYADRIPSQEQFDTYYREMSKYGFEVGVEEDRPEDKRRFRDIGEAIEPFIPSQSDRVLEIGCSTGGLLAVLREDGYGAGEGLDPSPDCARAALRIRGVPVQVGSIFEHCLGREEFDFVILVGVLEHLVDVGGGIQRVRELCKPRGRVYVEVPDALRFVEFLDAPFQQFSMEHVSYFSRATLERAMEVNGFRTRSCWTTVRAHTASSQMPVICGVFDCSASAAAVRPRDSQTTDRLEAYVRESARIEAGILQAVNCLVDSGEPFLVWGLGTLTRRLLSTSRLGQGNIRAFVDSNPVYQGARVGSVPVIEPAEVPSFIEPILIGSLVFQEEIESQIRGRLGCRNRIVRFDG